MIEKSASCLMLIIPKEVSEKILNWAKANIKDEDIYNEEGKGLQKSHHVTLAPQINDENATEHIVDVMSGEEAKSISLGKVGFFVDPDKDYHVLKIAVSPEVLLPMREKVVQGIEMYNPSHEFNPHVTIAYVKPGACQNLDGSDEFDGMSCDIGSCVYSVTGGEDKYIDFYKQKYDKNHVNAIRSLINTKLSSRNI